LKIIGFLITLVSVFLISEGSTDPSDYLWLVIGILFLYPQIIGKVFNGKQQ
jgi:hypothetical protein